MKQARREKLEAVLASAEADFREKLLTALQGCASGQWGLFGQNHHLELPKGFATLEDKQSGATELIALGDEIVRFRAELGIAERFVLFARFLELRGRKTQNDLGDSRLAKAWLEELNA